MFLVIGLQWLFQIAYDRFSVRAFCETEGGIGSLTIFALFSMPFLLRDGVGVVYF